MTKPPYIAVVAVVAAVATVIMYVTSYYLGRGLLGYHNLSVSLALAMTPGATLSILWIIRRVQNRG